MAGRFPLRMVCWPFHCPSVNCPLPPQAADPGATDRSRIARAPGQAARLPREWSGEAGPTRPRGQTNALLPTGPWVGVPLTLRGETMASSHPIKLDLEVQAISEPPARQEVGAHEPVRALRAPVAWASPRSKVTQPSPSRPQQAKSSLGSPLGGRSRLHGPTQLLRQRSPIRARHRPTPRGCPAPLWRRSAPRRSPATSTTPRSPPQPRRVCPCPTGIGSAAFTDRTAPALPADTQSAGTSAPPGNLGQTSRTKSSNTVLPPDNPAR